MLKLLISCWYDGVVVACRYMFAMGSDVVLVLLLLYCTHLCGVEGNSVLFPVVTYSVTYTVFWTVIYKVLTSCTSLHLYIILHQLI